jgi:hypothetical protein
MKFSALTGTIVELAAALPSFICYANGQIRVRNLIEWNRKYNINSLPHFVEKSEYRDKIIIFEESTAILNYFELFNERVRGSSI